MLECDNATPPKGGKPKKPKAKPKPKPPTRRQLAARLQAARHRPGPAGDRYAHAFILTWLTVNDKTHVSSAVDRAVRKDLKARLARGKWSRWSDARQQEYGERLSSYMAVLSGIHKRTRRRREHPRQPHPLRRQRPRAHRYFFGKSMFLVKLTRKGVIDS